MKIYSQTDDYVLYEGNMLDMGEVIADNSIDSIVTDPPYGLTSISKRFGDENAAPAQFGRDGSFSRLARGFMGKEWDGSGIEYNVDAWRRCYNVLKPGGYLLAFGGSRTFHRIAVAIEDAGFEIRDVILWLYGSGFPKSLNIGLAIDKKNGVDNRTGNLRTDGVGSNSGTGVYNLNDAESTPVATVYEERVALNEWSGWGTALKPAYEPIIVARKPCAGSCVENVLTYGVGGINIDECRIDHDEPVKYTTRTTEKSNGLYMGKFKNTGSERSTANPSGRYPSNVILTYDETDRAEVCGGMPETKSTRPAASDNRTNVGNSMFIDGVHTPGNNYDDEGSASRYFYTAKASARDRDEGLELLNAQPVGYGNQALAEIKRGNIDKENTSLGLNNIKMRKNTHPTVKPTDLMQYLVRLVTPRGGTVLDPFNGSGSTGKACMFENKDRDAKYKYIGIELTPEYLPIAEARIKFAAGYTDEITEEQQKGQLTIFDILGGAS